VTPTHTWLSFADDNGFLGAAIVDEDDFAKAILKTVRLGINPGGGVKGFEIDISGAPLEMKLAPVNRLMQRDELLRRGLIEETK
jgi:hypothetical protein